MYGTPAKSIFFIVRKPFAHILLSLTLKLYLKEKTLWGRANCEGSLGFIKNGSCRIYHSELQH